MSDKEWEQRSKTRSLEIAAVGEAIKILTDDDAHDLSALVLKNRRDRVASLPRE